MKYRASLGKSKQYLGGLKSEKASDLRKRIEAFEQSKISQNHDASIRDAERAYSACLEDHECNDQEALDACLDVFRDEEDACPYLPEDVAEAADGCWSLED